MSNMLRPLCAALLVCVAACASAPPAYQTVPPGPATHVVGPSPRFAKLDHLHRFLDDSQTIVYFQNHGGGGVAVGLMGPLGALANVEMIKGVTESEAQSFRGKLPVDVRAAFSNALATRSHLSLAEAGVLLSPYLLVQKVDGDHIHFAALLIVDYASTGGKWRRQYVYELPAVHSRDELAAGLSAAELQGLSDGFASGMRWNIETYARERAGQFSLGEKSTIHSDFVTPRIQVPILGNRFDAGQGRIGFMTGEMIYSLNETSARITK